MSEPRDWRTRLDLGSGDADAGKADAGKAEGENAGADSGAAGAGAQDSGAPTDNAARDLGDDGDGGPVSAVATGAANQPDDAADRSTEANERLYEPEEPASAAQRDQAGGSIWSGRAVGPLSRLLPGGSVDPLVGDMPAQSADGDQAPLDLRDREFGQPGSVPASTSLPPPIATPDDQLDDTSATGSGTAEPGEPVESAGAHVIAEPDGPAMIAEPAEPDEPAVVAESAGAAAIAEPDEPAVVAESAGAAAIAEPADAAEPGRLAQIAEPTGAVAIAEPAGAAEPANAAEPSNVAESRAAAEQAAADEPGDAGESLAEPVPAEADVTRAEDRWRSVLVGFVDDPRASVEAASALIEEDVARHIALLARHKEAMRSAWRGDPEVDTEVLRVALVNYRDLRNRLADVATVLTRR